MLNHEMIEAGKAVTEARRLQQLRTHELLASALAFYHGEMDEQDFFGAVCRYGAAITEAQITKRYANNVRAAAL